MLMCVPVLNHIHRTVNLVSVCLQAGHIIYSVQHVQSFRLYSVGAPDVMKQSVLMCKLYCTVTL